MILRNYISTVEINRQNALTSRYNECIRHVYDGVELRILLHLVLDPAAEVFPESVDPLCEASELRVAQLLKE